MRAIFQSRSPGTNSFGHTRGHLFIIFVLSLFLFGTGCGSGSDGYDNPAPTGDVAVPAGTGTISEQEEIEAEAAEGAHTDPSRFVVPFAVPSGELPRPIFSSVIDAYPKVAAWKCDPVAKPGVLGFRQIVIDAYGVSGGITRACSVGTNRSYHKMGLAFDWSMQAVRDADRINAVLNWLFETDEHGNPHARLRRLGVVRIIWNRHLWNAENANDRKLGADIHTWRDYNSSGCFASNPGADCDHVWHVHFTFSKDAGDQSTTWWTPQLGPFNGTFADDDDSKFEADIEAIYAAGITKGCVSGERPLFCPKDPVSRYHMAIFLVRAFNLPLTSTDYFSDDDGHKYEQYANALAEARITMGCGNGKFCGERNTTRGEMVTFLDRAVSWPPSSTDHFDDDNGRFYEPHANAARDVGVTYGCGPRMFCGKNEIKREQLAAFLSRTLGLR